MISLATMLPTTIIGLVGFFLVFFLFIIVFLIAAMTPAFTFLRARLGGRILLFNIRPDKRLDIGTASYDGGVISSKKYGYFTPVIDSMYSVVKGSMGCFVFGNYGITLPPEIVKALEQLKKENKIKGKSDFDLVKQFYHKCTYEKIAKGEDDKDEKIPCGFEGIPMFRNVMEGKVVVGSEMVCPGCGNGKTLEKAEILLSIPKHETVKFQEIAEFMKFVNPHYLEASAERKVAKVLQKHRDPMVSALKWVVLLFLILGGFTMLYIMLQMFGQG